MILDELWDSLKHLDLESPYLLANLGHFHPVVLKGDPPLVLPLLCDYIVIKAMSDKLQHACFYTDNVTFRVGDCLFKVPRGPFESESIVFRDMFLLPTGDLHKEGESDENPIHLTGITKDEFEQLLSVLFHRTYGTCQKSLPETNDEWTSVLKLTSLWGFDTICQVAIDNLQDMPAVDKIVLGETYDLDFESWLLPAMHEIVRRHEPISVDEGQHMGLEMALKLASVREQVSFRSLFEWKRVPCDPTPGQRPNVEMLDFAPILRKTFKMPPMGFTDMVDLDGLKLTIQISPAT